MRLVIFNLFLAIVLNCYNEIIIENEAIISSTKIDFFLTKWAEFDPDATGFIKFDHLIYILFDTHPPLGFKSYDEKPLSI